ncbi:MAG: terpene cyclase/mutase family protein [Planctomycetes bacterium]|nr:terpene cyclase/mutase family protein [Planctomycetota bacterium]
MQVCLVLVTLAALQAPDPAQVDAAVKKGGAFLLKKYEKGLDPGLMGWNLELLMLSLSHANVERDNEVFQKGLKELETSKLEYTYRVASLAMALGRIDPVKHQTRIAYCAQWLVDTQLGAGEWGYPGTVTQPGEIPKPIEVAAPKVEAGPKIKIKRQPNKNVDLRVKGDISNTQFAVLALKACADAGIEVPKETWSGALAFVQTTQNPDGGWGYCFGGEKDPSSYASMTCAGVTTMAICRYALGHKDAAKDTPVKVALGWLGKSFRPDKNANVENGQITDPGRWLYYYLYSIERTGMILGTEMMGKEKWYPAGAKYLLGKQKEDGSWWTGALDKAVELDTTADTCFAILFLTKATPSLTATEGARKK